MIVASFVNPVLVTLPFFGFKVYTYGLCIAAALASCVGVVEMEIRRLKISADGALLMLAFIPGFGIGSKVHLLVSSLAAGGVVPNMSLETGHSFMGSAVGGLLTASLYGSWCGLRTLVLLDLIAPLVPLGHAVGKVGCFLSGDGCYGPRTRADAPWAMSFPNGLVPVREPVHPTPLYESALSMALFLFLHFAVALPQKGGRQRRVGVRSALTLSLYGLERMLVEPFRRHPPSEYLFGLTEYQFLAVIFILIGGVLYALGSTMEPWPLKLSEQDFGEDPDQAEDKDSKKSQ
ncbi:lgt [Symbiodinium necroappetens]|uniref:Lgt protein n=1 Tax=Symbiodinium necroappetens TaxID=1628268 RepID=A0A812NIW8_9DINO|nr:lgt [Symbiodinium necroappetens]